MMPVREKPKVKTMTTTRRPGHFYFQLLLRHSPLQPEALSDPSVSIGLVSCLVHRRRVSTPLYTSFMPVLHPPLVNRGALWVQRGCWGRPPFRSACVLPKAVQNLSSRKGACILRCNEGVQRPANVRPSPVRILEPACHGHRGSLCARGCGPMDSPASKFCVTAECCPLRRLKRGPYRAELCLS